MAQIEVRKYFNPDYNSEWSKEDWAIVTSVRDELNLPTKQEQLQYIEERRRDDKNRKEDQRLFNISINDDVDWGKFKEEGNDENSQNKHFIKKSRIALLFAKNPLVFILVALSPVIVLLVLSLFTFTMGSVTVGKSPFEFCAPTKPVKTEDKEGQFADAIGFGNYLKTNVEGISHEQILGILGSIAIESSEMGTKAYQSYYVDSPEVRETKIAKDNKWWLSETEGQSGSAMGLIQWDPASKLLNVAVERGVHWTDKDLQFELALSYFQGRPEWNSFMESGKDIAYYAGKAMDMEGCQVGVHGCTYDERTKSAERFKDEVFTGGGSSTVLVNGCKTSEAEFGDKYEAYKSFVTYVTGEEYDTLHAQLPNVGYSTTANESLGHKTSTTDGGYNGFIIASTQSNAQCTEIVNGFVSWWTTRGGNPEKATPEQLEIFMSQAGATEAMMSADWGEFKGRGGARLGPNFGFNGVQATPGLGFEQEKRSDLGVKYFVKPQYAGTFKNEGIVFSGTDGDPLPGDLGWWNGHVYLIGPLLEDGKYEIFQQNSPGPNLAKVAPDELEAWARLP